ncbi:hypothetical protein TRV_06884 [Trichophyton verrucosum HKI 0517]|uniref:Uncharacterized protein n=1 Tax=Trichophyton verrucosum (strain HKI 0517) TaxID=663202 RepID=D4DI76_TRIVH|nr:uncharacterized protein TRV_06884 [Trichophyton verrucosum HKI 0517]EFE38460.1 hypothetical protein TRV_06884 [Trichophyton verrucosum HKI 0517]
MRIPSMDDDGWSAVLRMECKKTPFVQPGFLMAEERLHFCSSASQNLSAGRFLFSSPPPVISAAFEKGERGQITSWRLASAKKQSELLRTSVLIKHHQTGTLAGGGNRYLACTGPSVRTFTVACNYQNVCVRAEMADG